MIVISDTDDAKKELPFVLLSAELALKENINRVRITDLVNAHNARLYLLVEDTDNRQFLIHVTAPLHKRVNDYGKVHKLDFTSSEDPPDLRKLDLYPEEFLGVYRWVPQLALPTEKDDQ